MCVCTREKERERDAGGDMRGCVVREADGKINPALPQFLQPSFPTLLLPSLHLTHSVHST